MCGALSRKYCHITCTKYIIKENWYVLRDKETWPKSTGKIEMRATAVVRNYYVAYIYTTIHVWKHCSYGWEVFCIYARQMTREKLFFSFASLIHIDFIFILFSTLYMLLFFFSFFLLISQRNHAVRIIDFCVIRYTSKIPWKATQTAIIDGWILGIIIIYCIMWFWMTDYNEQVANFNPLKNFRSNKITLSLLTFGSKCEFYYCLI